MLHAPLTKLLAEAEGWKLTTALNALCHPNADYHDAVEYQAFRDG